MVTFDKNDKNLAIPSALGNFQSNGGGSGVTPAQVQQMIDSSLTEYDETVQGYISGVESGVEQNEENIQDLSGTTSALTEGLNSLSGTVSSMGEDIVSLSAQTAQITAITADLQALSAYTETLPTGSTYELPIATDSVLGGIKVGSGLTIDSSGTLSVSGGSSAEQDYLIVPALSSVTETKDGVLAYLSGYSYTAETDCIKIAPTSAWDNPEGFLAHIKRISNEENIADIYMSGNNFYWDWTNNGKWNERNLSDHIIRYKTYNDENWVNCYFLLNKADLTAAGYYVAKAGDRQESEVVIEDYTEYAASYSPHSFNLFESGWTKATVPQVYVIDKMTQAERVNLYNFIETNYFDTGVYDLSNFLFYFTVKNDETVAVPFNIINHYTDTIVFSYAGTRYDDTSQVEIRRGFLYSDGTCSVDGPRTFGEYHPERLNILYIGNYVKFDCGIYSGFTFDVANAPFDATAVEWNDPNWSWLVKIFVSGEGNYYDGDMGEIQDDNKLYPIDRNNHKYYRIRTGSTITYLFTEQGPASISDFTLDANVTYTAVTETSNYYAANDRGDVIYTGNTCSNDWQFDSGVFSQLCDCDEQVAGRNPTCALWVTSGTAAERRFVNPVISYESIPEITLYDTDGNPHNFNRRFYFDYIKYTLSLISDGFTRYAQLQVTAN